MTAYLVFLKSSFPLLPDWVKSQKVPKSKQKQIYGEPDGKHFNLLFKKKIQNFYLF